MRHDRKPVVIQYRKLKDLTGHFRNMSLEAALKQAVLADHNGAPISNDPVLRSQTDDPSYGIVLLNDYHDSRGYFFGEIVRFEKDAQLPLLNLRGRGKAYDLVQASAPEDHESLKGTLYFMAFGNHVTLLSNEIASNRLDSYLKWILSRATNTLERACGFTLNASIELDETPASLNKIDHVSYKPSAAPQFLFPEKEDISATKTAHETIDSSVATKLLKLLGLHTPDIYRLAEQSLDIDVKIELKFISGKKRKSITMDDAGHIFRDVEAENLTLKGPNGTIHGRLLKLSYPTHIQTIGTLLDAKDAERKLLEAFEFFIENNNIVS